MASASGAGRRRTARPRVLVVDDDPVTRAVVRTYLERDELTVLEESDGETALAALSGGADSGGDEDSIDLAVLEVCLPGRSGLDICREIRAGSHRPDLPIILLSALGSQDGHRVHGLEAGADDCVAKPFSPRELALRVAAVLRRCGVSPAPAGAELRDGGIRVWPDSQVVLVDGARVELTRRECQLLIFLLRHPGAVFARRELLSRVWGWEYGDLSTVTVHVKRLRAKLGAQQRITTVWGSGYCWGPVASLGPGGSVPPIAKGGQKFSTRRLGDAVGR